jgi:hypothetical protein
VLPELRGVAVRGSPSRQKRAALYAVGAATLLTAGCLAETAPIPVYGAPADLPDAADAGGPTSGDATRPDATCEWAVPLYGGPAVPLCHESTDGGSE